MGTEISRRGGLGQDIVTQQLSHLQLYVSLALSLFLQPHPCNFCPLLHSVSQVTLPKISIATQNKKPGSVPSVIITIHPALWFSSSHQIHSLWFPSQGSCGSQFFKPFQLRIVKERETTVSVYVWCSWCTATFLRVSSELTTQHHGVCGSVTQ